MILGRRLGVGPQPTFDQFDIFQFNFPIAAIQKIKALVAVNDGRADEADILAMSQLGHLRSTRC